MYPYIVVGVNAFDIINMSTNDAAPCNVMIIMMIIITTTTTILSSQQLVLECGAQQSQLRLTPSFYEASCPSLELVVKSSIMESVQRFPITRQAVLRLFFHDCFVEGCDASILISTPGSERDAPPNQSLAGDGFRAIQEAKRRVEMACPGIVSCADILAIAARDVVALANGPTWTVLKGRRDGMVSSASRVPGNLPEANYNVDELKAAFKAKGLNATDVVALSGAHTIGFAHCEFFTSRLYQFNTTYQVDPSLDAQYAKTLEGQCPFMGGDVNMVLPLDPTSPFSFDNTYYINLQNGKGLLSSDESLWTDATTKDLVHTFASNQMAFFSSFASSMVKLGNVGIKTGTKGEIRKDCSSFNA